METLITPTQFCAKYPQYKMTTVRGWIRRGLVKGSKQKDRRVLCKERELYECAANIELNSIRKIFDVFEQKIIEIPRYQITNTALSIGSRYETLSCLLAGKCKHIFYRYVRLEDRYKNFVLVETESGQEYECVRPNSLILQLRIPQESRWGCAISDLRAGRRHIATIGDKSYQLKGETKFNPTRRMKCRNSKLEAFFSQRDLESRMKRALRARIHHALFKSKTKKTNRTLELIGCSIGFLKSYLADKFIGDMSWENYGYRGWHIDHIIPCSAFDLTKEEEQKKCFHYTNLQPLWAEDNMAKHDKLDF